MELWPHWINRLQRFVPELALQRPLLQVAPDEATEIRFNDLASQRQQLGLRTLTPAELDAIWPGAEHGGLLSEQDGRVDPLKLQRSLRRALEKHQVTQVAEPVDALERHRSGWRVVRTGGQRDHFAAVVICAALASAALLAPLGHDRPMTPVLGQALRLELNETPTNWQQWPAVLVDQGVNLIPDGPHQLLLGATVEPGSEAAEDPLALMRSLHGQAPDWLKSATVYAGSLSCWDDDTVKPSAPPVRSLRFAASSACTTKSAVPRWEIWVVASTPPKRSSRKP